MLGEEEEEGGMIGAGRGGRKDGREELGGLPGDA